DPPGRARPRPRGTDPERGADHARLGRGALRVDPPAGRARGSVPRMSDVPAPRFGHPRNDLAGAGLAVLMGVQFSFVVILGKGLLRGQPPFALLFIRFAVAAVILAVVTVATNRPLTPEPGERLGLALAAPPGDRAGWALCFAALTLWDAAPG